MRFVSYVFYVATFFAQFKSSAVVISAFSCAPEPNVAACSSSHHVFEGVEKRIEISFDVSPEDVDGLRRIPRLIWDEVCKSANCLIVHHDDTACYDAYILSESSLFVYRDRVIMKTCGTTLPLSSVDLLASRATAYSSIRLKEMVYSRSNFLFPSDQLHPHNHLGAEMEYLQSMVIAGNHVEGETRVLGGPEFDDDDKYWLVHRKIFSPEIIELSSDRSIIECIMTDLPLSTRSRYFKDNEKLEEENEAEMAASLSNILPHFRIVGKCYEPCGYSCNAVCDDRYFTVHITPEEGFSYASVEAVFTPDTVDEIGQFVQSVTETFRPGKLVITYNVPATHIQSPLVGYTFVTQTSVELGSTIVARIEYAANFSVTV